METQTKTIQVLLTRNYDLFSQLIYQVTGHGYTHASLGLEEECARFYSFNVKGFCEETPEKHRRHGVDVSRCYQLEVSEAAYELLWQSIQDFKAHKKQYHYAHLGVILCLLRISFREKNGYFCSQFVAELLKKAGVLDSKKKSNLYLPNQFQWDLRKLSVLKEVKYCVI